MKALADLEEPELKSEVGGLVRMAISFAVLALVVIVLVACWLLAVDLHAKLLLVEQRHQEVMTEIRNLEARTDAHGDAIATNAIAIEEVSTE